MRKSAALVIPVLAFAAFGSASPAFASGSPVHATVQVATTLTLDGINPNVPFGTVIPGTTSTVAGAESPHVVTNDSHGAGIYVSGENGGFHTAIGQPDVLTDNAVSVKTGNAQAVSLRNDGAPVQVGNAATGDNTYSEDWLITIPASTPAGDPLFADFTYSAIAG